MSFSYLAVISLILGVSPSKALLAISAYLGPVKLGSSTSSTCSIRAWRTFSKRSAIARRDSSPSTHTEIQSSSSLPMRSAKSICMSFSNAVNFIVCLLWNSRNAVERPKALEDTHLATSVEGRAHTEAPAEISIEYLEIGLFEPLDAAEDTEAAVLGFEFIEHLRVEKMRGERGFAQVQRVPKAPPR